MNKLNWIADKADKAVVNALWTPPEEKPKKRPGKNLDAAAAGLPVGETQPDAKSDSFAAAKMKSQAADASPDRPAASQTLPDRPLVSPRRSSQTLPDRPLASPRRSGDVARSKLEAPEPNEASLLSQVSVQVPRCHSDGVVLDHPPSYVSVPAERVILAPPARSISLDQLAHSREATLPVQMQAAAKAKAEVGAASDAMHATFGEIIVNKMPSRDIREGYIAGGTPLPRADSLEAPAPRAALDVCPQSNTAAGDTALDIDDLGLDDDYDVIPTPASASEASKRPVSPPCEAASAELVNAVTMADTDGYVVVVRGDEATVLDLPANTAQDKESEEKLASRETTASAEAKDSSQETSNSILSQALALQRLAEEPLSPTSPTSAADLSAGALLSQAMRLQTLAMLAEADVGLLSTEDDCTARGSGSEDAEEVVHHISPEIMALAVDGALKKEDDTTDDWGKEASVPKHIPWPWTASSIKQVKAVHQDKPVASNVKSLVDLDSEPFSQAHADAAAKVASKVYACVEAASKVDAAAETSSQVDADASAEIPGEIDIDAAVEAYTAAAEPSSEVDVDAAMEAVFEAARHTAQAASNATSSLCHISALIVEEEEDDFDACIPTDVVEIKRPAPPKKDWRYFAQQKLQGKEPALPKAVGASKVQ